jgi:hypothetical protein
MLECFQRRFFGSRYKSHYEFIVDRVLAVVARPSPKNDHNVVANKATKNNKIGKETKTMIKFDVIESYPIFDPFFLLSIAFYYW